MAGRPRAHSVDSPTPEQSQMIQNLMALIQAQTSQVQNLLNLHHPQNPLNQPRQSTSQTMYERFLKPHPTEFYGGPDPAIAEEWIRSLEVIFEYLEMNDRDRIHCALFLLKNEARHWWEGTKASVQLDNTTWEAFKQLFFEKYFSQTVRARKLKEFLDIRQTSPVADYARRFEQGCLYAAFMTRDEKEKTNHFLRGLNPIIRRDVRFTSNASFREVVDRALTAEQDELEIRQGRVPHLASSQPHKKPNLAQNKGKQIIQKAKPVCPKCKKEHYGECMLGTNTCFKCRQTGHMVKYCPNAAKPVPGRVFAMTQEQAKEDPDIITGTISIQSIPAYVLIDSGSTHSFISRTLVAKLRVVPSDTPVPYCITTPSGIGLKTNKQLSNFPIQVPLHTLQSTLIILPIAHFDVILGMN